MEPLVLGIEPKGRKRQRDWGKRATEERKESHEQEKVLEGGGRGRGSKRRRVLD